MKKILIIILATLALIAGCGKNSDKTPVQTTASSTEASVTTKTTIPETTSAQAGEAENAENPQFEHNWQALYYDELAKHIDDIAVKFSLYDLDENGTPELLLSEGPYHAAQCALYTVYRDELVYLGAYGGWGEFGYDFERNYLHSYFHQMGEGYLWVYSFKDAELTHIISFYSFDGNFAGKPAAEFKIGDENVSQEAFNAECEKYYFDSREDFIIRKHKATTEAIISALNGFYQ